jgi:hypothetical protein
LRTVVDFMKFRQRDMHYEIARLDDPRPFLFELGQFASALSTSAARFVRRLPRRDLPTPAIHSIH